MDFYRYLSSVLVFQIYDRYIHKQVGDVRQQDEAFTIDLIHEVNKLLELEGVD